MNTLSTAIDEWLTSLEPSYHPDTLASHRHAIRLFASWFEQHAPLDKPLDFATLEAYVQYLRTERALQYTTLRAYVGVLIRWLAWLVANEHHHLLVSVDQLLDEERVRQRLLSEDVIGLPTAQVEQPTPDLRRLPAFYDIQRQHWLEQHTIAELTTDILRRRTYLNILRNRAFIATLFASGARLSQVLALRTDELVEPGLRLDDLAREWIAAYLEVRAPWYADAEAIFISHGPRADGEPMSPDSAERAVKAAALWLADRRFDEGADPDEIETLRAVSAEGIRRFLDAAKRAAADQFFPKADLTDAHRNQEHP